MACFNFVFALVVLGLSIGALTITLGDAILFIISGAMVRTFSSFGGGQLLPAQIHHVFLLTFLPPRP